jgi:hypothetical protein
MLEVEPVSSIWMPLVEGSHIFPSERKENWEAAFLTAYRLLRESCIVAFSLPSEVSIYIISYSKHPKLKLFIGI